MKDQDPDPIAEFLVRGGTITRCPTASVEESSAAPSSADQRRIAHHETERESVVIFRWGYQNERQRRTSRGVKF